MDRQIPEPPTVSISQIKVVICSGSGDHSLIKNWPLEIVNIWNISFLKTIEKIIIQKYNMRKDREPSKMPITFQGMEISDFILLKIYGYMAIWTLILFEIKNS